MILPLILIILGLFLALWGFAAAFGGGWMATPSPIEEHLVLLLPIGAFIAIVGAIWALLLLCVRWLT